MPPLSVAVDKEPLQKQRAAAGRFLTILVPNLWGVSPGVYGDFLYSRWAQQLLAVYCCSFQMKKGGFCKI